MFLILGICYLSREINPHESVKEHGNTKKHERTSEKTASQKEGQDREEGRAREVAQRKRITSQTTQRVLTMKRCFEVYGLQTEQGEDGKPYTYLAPHDHELFVDDKQDDGQREFANTTEVIQAVQDWNNQTKNPDHKNFGKPKFAGEISIIETYEF